MSSAAALLEAWEGAEAAALAEPWPHAVPPEAHAALTPTLTEYGSSRFGLYRTCQRAHALRYTQRVVPLRIGPPSTADYFGLGSLIHAALAYAWEGQKQGVIRDWRDVLHAATQQHGGIRLDTLKEAERLLEAYWAFYGLNDWEGNAGVAATIVDVEREFCAESHKCESCAGTGRIEHPHWEDGGRPPVTTPCGACDGRGYHGELGPLPYTARLDLVVEVEGIIHVVDTKTRAKGLPSNRAQYARRLRTRAQFIGQAWLAKRAYGLSYVPPVIVNAIVKTKIPGFARLLVPLEQRDLDTWAEAQREAAAAGLCGSAMNYSSCAPEIGSPCAYLDYCHGSDEQRVRLFGVADLAQAVADAHSIDVAA